MGFRTIDLDQPGGYQRYEKLRETKSVKETFKDLDEQEQKPTFFADDEKRVSSFANEAKRIMPEEIKKGVVYGVMQLRVREKPEGEVISMISDKSIVTILDEYEGWYKVEYTPSKTGYVMRQYIKEYKESVGG